MGTLCTGGPVLALNRCDRVASGVAVRDGTVIGAGDPLSPLEALRAYTLNSTAAMFRDLEVGSIDVGKRADLVVLSHAPTLVDST